MVKSEDILEEYFKGYNFSQIARNLECSRNTVKKYIRQYVIQTGNVVSIRSNSKFSLNDFEDIIELKNGGMLVTEIAAMYDVSTSYIYRIIREYSNVLCRPNQSY